MNEPEDGFSAGLAYIVSEADRGRPEELYALFRQPTDESGWHIAMSGVRRPDEAITARRESWGGVAVRLRPSEAGMTTEAVDKDGLVLCFDQNARDAPQLVYGLVADHVTAVDVEWLGRSRPARVENNAFAALVDAQFDDAISIVLTRADGTSVRI